MNHFETLNKINVNDKVEKKNGLTYLSWAFGWSEVKKIYPDAFYIIKKFDGLPYVFDPKTGYMVFTEVTIEGHTHEMWLPVMDGANKAMKDEPYKYTTKYGEKTCDAADMFDINKTIMRCLVKNLAMFGLGLYIYAGEDLPEDEAEPIIKESVVPMSKRLSRPVGEPAKITYACPPSEYDRRCAEVVKTVKKTGKTEKQYTAIKATIDTRSLKEMTAPEYDAFLLKLTDALK